MSCCVVEPGTISHAATLSSASSRHSPSFALRALRYRNPSFALRAQQQMIFARKYAQPRSRPVFIRTAACETADFAARWPGARFGAATAASENDNVSPFSSSRAPFSRFRVSACSSVDSSSVGSFSCGCADAVAFLPPNCPSPCPSAAADAHFKAVTACWNAFPSRADAFPAVKERDAWEENAEHRRLLMRLRQQQRQQDGQRTEWSPSGSDPLSLDASWKESQAATLFQTAGYCSASHSEKIHTIMNQSIRTLTNPNSCRMCYSDTDSAESGVCTHGRSCCAGNRTISAAQKRRDVLLCTFLNCSNGIGTTQQMTTVAFFQKMLGSSAVTPGHRQENPDHSCTAMRAGSQLQTLSSLLSWRTKGIFLPTLMTMTSDRSWPPYSHCDSLPRRALLYRTLSVTRSRLVEEARQSGHQFRAQTRQQQHRLQDRRQQLASEEKETPALSQRLQRQQLLIKSCSLCKKQQQQQQIPLRQSQERREGPLQERNQASRTFSVGQCETEEVRQTPSLDHRNQQRHYYMTASRHLSGWGAVKLNVLTEQARKLLREGLSTTATTATAERLNQLAPRRTFCCVCRSKMGRTCLEQTPQGWYRSERKCQEHARTFWWRCSAGRTEVSGGENQAPPQPQVEGATSAAVSSCAAAADTEIQEDKNLEELPEKKGTGVSQTPLKKAPLTMTFVSADGETVLPCSYRPGQTVLMVAFENDVGIEGVCGGQCACSTCHVIVQEEFFEKFPPPDDDEQDLLDTTIHTTDTSRLACQLRLSEEHDGLQVRLPSATINQMYR